MDYKIFKLSDSRIIQIASKEKMHRWKGEAPLVYINYLRDNHLRSYGSKANQKEIATYLDESMQEIAIPKLIEALDSPIETEVSVEPESIYTTSVSIISLIASLTQIILSLIRLASLRPMTTTDNNIFLS